MKQVLRKGLKEIIVTELPDPVVIPHHVLIRPMYSLISSGTESASIHRESLLRTVAENPSYLQKIWDVIKAQGPCRTLSEVKAKFSEYAVLGYAGAGIVVDKHSTITDLDIGERVAYGGEGTGHGETILAGRNLVARLPHEVSYKQGCFTTLGSIALNAVRIARLGIGDIVAIIGMGLIGQLIGQLVRRQGGVVIAIDLRPGRLALAHRWGAEHCLLATQPIQESVLALTNGRGADCVIVAAASPSADPSLQALQICRDRGRLVVVGAVGLSFPWHEMYRKEIQLFMARAYGPGSYDPAYEKQGQDYPISYVRWTENRNMEEFLRLVLAGAVQIEPLITHEYPLEDAPEAYQTVMDSTSRSLAVLLRYPALLSEQEAVRFVPQRRVGTQAGPTVSPVRVALVGAGNLARWTHLPNLKKIPGTTLRAVCSSNGARGKNYALRFGAAYCCTDYQEILADSDVDVVLITSRNQDHAAQALSALKAGKHVFLEKPLALTEEECRLLCRAVSETGRQLTVGFNRRFAPLYRQLKKELARRPGPAVVNCRVVSPTISGSYWMADPAIGGAILGEACHFVDLMYWLLEEEPVSVSAFCLPTGPQEPIGQNNLVASVRFSRGSVGNLTYCTLGSQGSGGERVEVFAPGLSMSMEDFKQLTVNTGRRRKRSHCFADKGYPLQLQSFFASICHGNPPEVTVRDGTRATTVCLRMLESARTLRPCTVELDAVLG